MIRRFGPTLDNPDGKAEDLPWLEPAPTHHEDDDDEGRLIPRKWLIGGGIGFGVALLGLVGLIYVKVAGPDKAADENAAQVDSDKLPLIEAPKDPVRVRPENPGGMQVPNQDLSVMDVASGDAKPEPTQMAQAPEAPLERTAPATPAANAPKATPPLTQAAPQPAAVNKPTPSAPQATQPQGLALQLGAFSTQERADTAWKAIHSRYASLSNMSPNIQSAGGNMFRLRAGPVASDEDARRICAELKAQGQACVIVR